METEAIFLRALINIIIGSLLCVAALAVGAVLGATVPAIVVCAMLLVMAACMFYYAYWVKQTDAGTHDIKSKK